MKVLEKKAVASNDDLSDSIDGKVTVCKINAADALEALSKLPEDEFKSTGNINDDSNAPIIDPPYDLHALYALQQVNNTLLQCIDTMEVNVHGSGYTIEAKNPDSDKDDTDVKNQKEWARDFFDEVYPKKSYTTIRKKVARDLESTGNGYIEVIRTITGKIQLLNHADAKTMRFIKLGDPVNVIKTLRRNGKDTNVLIAERERRFVQINGTKRVYFKEFGVKTKLNKVTGQWERKADPEKGLDEVVVPRDLEATELIHLKVVPDTNTPYGVPRWINQVPSILGSRKAEEFNLMFFQSGGLPPAIIFIEGGGMTKSIRNQLQKYLSGKTKGNNQMAIVELFSTSGTLDKAGKVKVNVERFGPQDDSMFEKYDQRCEERTRGSFRLPPLFVGKTGDMNFATAFASYITAETQVFKPERDDHDELINLCIMRDLGFDKVLYKSKPMSIKESKIELEGIKIARDAKAITKGEVVKGINKATNLDLMADPTIADELVDESTRNGENENPDENNPREIDGATPDNGPLDGGRGTEI